VNAVSGEAKENFLEGNGTGAAFQRSRSVASEEAAGVDNGDSVGEKFDFGESVRSKEQGSAPMAKDFGFQETAEFRGADGVETARGLVKEKHAGMVEQDASQAETLNGAGGESAHLAIQGFADLELFREQGDTLGGRGIRKLIQSAKKMQILTARQARVKTMIGAGVVAKTAADFARLVDGIVSGDTRAAGGGNEECGKNA
jgi:hypothetical protein